LKKSKFAKNNRNHKILIIAKKSNPLIQIYEGLFVKIKKTVLSTTFLVQNMHIELNSQIDTRQNAYLAK